MKTFTHPSAQARLMSCSRLSITEYSVNAFKAKASSNASRARATRSFRPEKRSVALYLHKELHKTQVRFGMLRGTCHPWPFPQSEAGTGPARGTDLRSSRIERWMLSGCLPVSLSELPCRLSQLSCSQSFRLHLAWLPVEVQQTEAGHQLHCHYASLPMLSGL